MRRALGRLAAVVVGVSLLAVGAQMLWVATAALGAARDALGQPPVGDAFLELVMDSAAG